MTLEEEYKDYTVQELFDEIINLEQGDMWEGMQSVRCKSELKAAKKVFGEKMIELGIDWK